MRTYQTVLERKGWTPEQVRELAWQLARDPEQARHLEQRVREVARRKAQRSTRR